MIANFNQSNQGNALLLKSNVAGWIVVFSAAPIWVGLSPSALSLQPAPAGPFNLEPRDGVYVPGATVTSMPWNGDLYVLNGKGPQDQQNNWASIQVMEDC